MQVKNRKEKSESDDDTDDDISEDEHTIRVREYSMGGKTGDAGFTRNGSTYSMKDGESGFFKGTSESERIIAGDVITYYHPVLGGWREVTVVKVDPNGRKGLNIDGKPPILSLSDSMSLEPTDRVCRVKLYINGEIVDHRVGTKIGVFRRIQDFDHVASELTPDDRKKFKIDKSLSEKNRQSDKEISEKSKEDDDTRR